MKSAIYITSAIVAVVALTSCEKELDFKYHDIDPILVIEASVSQHGMNVSLTETTPMDEAMTGIRITDASVTVEDITANESFNLPANADGMFVNSIAGIAGHEYKINITRDEHTYMATSLMDNATDIESMAFSWIKMPYDHVAVLKVSFKDISSDIDDHYWLRLYRNGEAYMWTALTDDLAVNGIIDAVIMTSRKDVSKEDEQSVLRDGDVVTASVSPISRAMYDYLEAISNDSNGPQMFSGSFCLGYFLAAPVATSSVVFHPDDIPY